MNTSSFRFIFGGNNSKNIDKMCTAQPNNLFTFIRLVFWSLKIQFNSMHFPFKQSYCIDKAIEMNRQSMCNLHKMYTRFVSHLHDKFDLWMSHIEYSVSHAEYSADPIIANIRFVKSIRLKPFRCTFIWFAIAYFVCYWLWKKMARKCAAPKNVRRKRHSFADAIKIIHRASIRFSWRFISNFFSYFGCNYCCYNTRCWES